MPRTNTATKRSTAKRGTTTAKSSTARSQAASKTGPGARPGSRAQASSRSQPNPQGQSRSRTQASAGVGDSKLKEFFIDELKDIYWAEQKLVKTLPKLAKAATSGELKSAFTDHLEETKTHVQRLEQAFKMMGEKASAKKCDAMEGITEEGSSVIEDTDEGTATRDVALVMAGQKAEHYEIATYGGLIQIARTMGHDDVAELLEQTLEEEKNADRTLTEIAEGGINYEASGEN
jgi:ferritin-like metal-binding protein YciE